MHSSESASYADSAFRSFLLGNSWAEIPRLSRHDTGQICKDLTEPAGVDRQPEFQLLLGGAPDKEVADASENLSRAKQDLLDLQPAGLQAAEIQNIVQDQSSASREEESS